MRANAVLFPGVRKPYCRTGLFVAAAMAIFFYIKYGRSAVGAREEAQG